MRDAQSPQTNAAHGRRRSGLILTGLAGALAALLGAAAASPRVAGDGMALLTEQSLRSYRPFGPTAVLVALSAVVLALMAVSATRRRAENSRLDPAQGDPAKPQVG